MPVALPPAGEYEVSISTVDDGGAVSGVAHVDDGGRLALAHDPWPDGLLRIVF
jgi:hypothetical protein